MLVAISKHVRVRELYWILKSFIMTINYFTMYSNIYIIYIERSDFYGTNSS